VCRTRLPATMSNPLRCTMTNTAYKLSYSVRKRCPRVQLFDALYLTRCGRLILRRKSLVSESYDELHSRFALSGDKPIESSAEDRLDRVRFAEALATQIATAPVTGSFVIGLTGPWGSGKTSLLNMVSETLTENQPDTVVLRFNPWLFSGTEQLVARFFEEMGTQLLEKPDEKLKRLGSALEVYGQLLSPLKFVPVAGSSFDIAAAAMKATGSFLQSRADEGPIRGSIPRGPPRAGSRSTRDPRRGSWTRRTSASG
jgi:hypothetical protein